MKKVMSILLALAMICALCACGQSSAPAPAPAATEAPAADAPAATEAPAAPVEKKELKWGSVHTDDALASQMMFRAIDEINANAEGITIVGYPNSVLGGSQDLVEGVQYGLVDIITEGPAQFGTIIPKAAQVEAPFMYQNVDHMMAALNGGYVADVLQPMFDGINVQVVGTFYYGTRQLTVNKEVHGIDDLKGMKIRVPQADLYIKMVDAWSAAASPMPLGDLYLALQTGTVDGQENPLTTYNAQKFFETNANYIIMTSHIICPNMIFMNQEVYNSLSEHDKEVVDTAMKNAVEWMTVEQQAAEAALVAELEGLGCTVITPDDSIRNATVPSIQPLVEDWDLIQSYAG